MLKNETGAEPASPLSPPVDISLDYFLVFLLDIIFPVEFSHCLGVVIFISSLTGMKI